MSLLFTHPDTTAVPVPVPPRWRDAIPKQTQEGAKDKTPSGLRRGARIASEHEHEQYGKPRSYETSLRQATALHAKPSPAQPHQHDDTSLRRAECNAPAIQVVASAVSSGWFLARSASCRRSWQVSTIAGCSRGPFTQQGFAWAEDTRHHPRTACDDGPFSPRVGGWGRRPARLVPELGAQLYRLAHERLAKLDEPSAKCDCKQPEGADSRTECHDPWLA